MSTELLPQLARRPASPQDSPRPVAGAGPYTLAFRRLRRDRVALGFGAIFLVIAAMCLAAPLYAHHIAHTGPADNHVTDTVRFGGQTHDVVSPDGHPHRADLARPLLPGRGPERPRHRRAAPVRRPQLARDRAGRDCDHDRLRDARGGRGRLLPRAGRFRPGARARPHLGVSRRDAWDRARHLARARRDQPGAVHAVGQLAAGTRVHHRVRLHPIRRAAGARPGPRRCASASSSTPLASRGSAACASSGARSCPTSRRR